MPRSAENGPNRRRNPPSRDESPGRRHRRRMRRVPVSPARIHARRAVRYAAARAEGVYHMEGRDYVVADGDVILFKFAV